MLMRGRRRRRADRPGSMARGGGRAPEAGEDSAEEEDGEEADAMSMGMRSPERSGQVEEETGCVPGADGSRSAGGARASAGRWAADSRRPAEAENPRGSGRRAPRKAAIGEDDGGGGGGGHDDDDGGGSGTKKWSSARGGGSLLLYIDTPLVLGRVMNRDKRGPFVTVGDTTRD
jgi:hypothetical protein